jgi:hypothetical protein
MPELPQMEPPYTYKQGQYLAFIYYYTKLNDRPPAERDLQNHLVNHAAHGSPNDPHPGEARLYLAGSRTGAQHQTFVIS